jgi:hypothetical protein
VVTSSDYVRAEVEELFCDGRREAKAASGVLAVNDEEIHGVGVDEVGNVLVRNVAAR